MPNVNKVFLMGNLTRDPELRYTAGGSSVTNLGLAINRKFKKGEEWQDETCFVDITVWGKQGENCAEYLSKGRPVFVEGCLNFRTWETEDGQKWSKWDVGASIVPFLGRGAEGRAPEPMADNSYPPPPPPEEAPGDDVPF